MQPLQSLSDGFIPRPSIIVHWYIFVLIPESLCSYFRIVVNLEIRKCEFPKCTLYYEDCFDFLDCLLFPMNLRISFFIAAKNKKTGCWNLDGIFLNF